MYYDDYISQLNSTSLGASISKPLTNEQIPQNDASVFDSANQLLIQSLDLNKMILSNLAIMQNVLDYGSFENTTAASVLSLVDKSIPEKKEHPEQSISSESRNELDLKLSYRKSCLRNCNVRPINLSSYPDVLSGVWRKKERFNHSVNSFPSNIISALSQRSTTSTEIMSTTSLCLFRVVNGNADVADHFRQTHEILRRKRELKKLSNSD